MCRNNKVTGAEAEGSYRIVAPETIGKTILSRRSLSDYSLNCYTGCVLLMDPLQFRWWNSCLGAIRRITYDIR